MKGKVYALPILLILLVMFSCERTLPEPDVSPLTLSEISGERLWIRITEEADYRSYGQWPGHDGIRPGQAPHGVWHSVFVNRTLRESLPLSSGKAPVGTIIVKENFTPSKELAAYTVMAKVEGFNPEQGDWFWAKYSAEGEIQAEGTPKGCLTCHSGREDNDYMIIKNIDEPLDPAE